MSTRSAAENRRQALDVAAQLKDEGAAIVFRTFPSGPTLSSFAIQDEDNLATYDQLSRDGNRVVNPVTLMVAGAPLEGGKITPGLVFVWGGQEYTVVRPTSYAPDGEIVIYWTVIGST